MARKSKSEIKQYFLTGCKPTQGQFENLIDTMSIAQFGAGFKKKLDSDGEVTLVTLDPNVTILNVSAITNQTYETPASAAAALITLEVIESITVGMKIAYNDAKGRVWCYQNQGTDDWILIGDREILDIDPTLDHKRINSLGELVISPIVSGTGTEADPYVYRMGSTPLIPVHAFESIYFHGKLDNGFIGVCGYKADKTLSSSYAIVVGNVDAGEVDRYIKASSLPADVAYVRFSSYIDYDNVFRVETDQVGIRNAAMIRELRSDVDELKLLNLKDGFYGFWNNKVLSPEMEESHGNREILNDWDFYLIEEDGDNTKIVGKLMKNNIFRFADGSYAPVVLCAAGEASEPWETEVDHHYAIVRAWNSDKYLLHGNTPDGRTVMGIFNEPISIDGCRSVRLEQTGINADLPTIYNDELRCIPMKGIDTGCGRAGGWDDGESYPCNTFGAGSYHARNASYLTNMEKARSKNDDATSVDVFSEQMFIHRMSHTVANFLKNATYNLHAIDKFGTGISENYYITEEDYTDLYGRVTGFRWKFEGDAEWHTAVGDTGGPTDWYFDTEQNYNLSDNIYGWLNEYYAYTQVLEPQCALSYAAENHIAAGTVFMYNGRKWHYENVPGTVGLLDGEMNARLFMHFDDEGSGLTDTTWYLNGYDADGNAKNVVLQGVFEIGVVDGFISWGGDWEPSGGEEVVSHRYNDKDGNEVQEVGYYLCINQHELTSDVSTNYANIPDDEPFDFMETYLKVGQFINEFPSGWTAGGCLPFTFLGKENGGDMHTGNCSYAYAWCAAQLGKLYRQAMWLRGAADDAAVSARCCNYDNSPDFSCCSYAFAYQVRLKGLPTA